MFSNNSISLGGGGELIPKFIVISSRNDIQIEIPADKSGFRVKQVEYYYGNSQAGYPSLPSRYAYMWNLENETGYFYSYSGSAYTVNNSSSKVLIKYWVNEAWSTTKTANVKRLLTPAYVSTGEYAPAPKPASTYYNSSWFRMLSDKYGWTDYIIDRWIAYT